jgi:hypothetical protein
VIGLVVRQVELEQHEPPVNRFGETKRVGEGVDGADAAVGDAAVALADFVMDVAGGPDRYRPTFWATVAFIA